MVSNQQFVLLQANRAAVPLAVLLACLTATVSGCKSEPPEQKDEPPKVVANPATGEKRERSEEELRIVAEIQSAGGSVTEMEDAACVTLPTSQVSPEDFANVVYLNEFQKVTVLYADSLDNRGMEGLAKLTELERIQIDTSSVTDAGFAHLAGLEKLNSLQITAPQLTDAGLEHLAGLTNLEDLWLPDSKITGPGLSHLTGLSELKSVALDNAPVTDAGLVYLAQLRKLEDLGLSGTKVTDGGIKYFEGHPTLKSIGLTDTQVTQTGVQSLAKSIQGLRVYK
jgi:hypothetical protein